MADKSSLRAMKKKIVDDILSTLSEAHNVMYHATSYPNDDSNFAYSLIKICERMLNIIHNTN